MSVSGQEINTQMQWASFSKKVKHGVNVVVSLDSNTRSPDKRGGAGGVKGDFRTHQNPFISTEHDLAERRSAFIAFPHKILMSRRVTPKNKLSLYDLLADTSKMTSS